MPRIADFAVPFLKECREAAHRNTLRACNQAKAQDAKSQKVLGHRNGFNAPKFRMEALSARETERRVAVFASRYGA